MKKLLLIPTLGLTAIAPVIAMTSCTKENGKKSEIVWEDPDKDINKFSVTTNKLDTTAWIFNADGSDIQCTSTGSNWINLEITETALRVSGQDDPSFNFYITIHGRKIQYSWRFHLKTDWADCKAEKPIENISYQN